MATIFRKIKNSNKVLYMRLENNYLKCVAIPTYINQCFTTKLNLGVNKKIQNLYNHRNTLLKDTMS